MFCHTGLAASWDAALSRVHTDRGAHKLALEVWVSQPNSSRQASQMLRIVGSW